MSKIMGTVQMVHLKQLSQSLKLNHHVSIFCGDQRQSRLISFTASIHSVINGTNNLIPGIPGEGIHRASSPFGPNRS